MNDQPKPKWGDVGQGARPDKALRLYTEADLKDFTLWQANQQDIDEAIRTGRLYPTKKP